MVRVSSCQNILSLRAGSLVGVGPRENAKGRRRANGARKSEPARELLSFKFPAFADEHSDLIG